MFLQKLPQLFKSNQLFANIAKSMEGKQVLFSSLVYSEKGKNYIILKHQKTPYFEVDWICYSILRCIANTFITSGANIRSQKDIYKAHASFGDKNLQQMYHNFRGDSKQNVYVMTNSMARQQILSYFNTNIYNVYDSTSLIQQKRRKITIYDIIEDALNKKLGPILVQCGPIVMKEYFEYIKKGQLKNYLDGVYLAFFQGQLQQSCIGNEFQFEQNLYRTTWQSQKYQIQWKGKNIGKVHFKVYKKNQ